ncbi:hypothetical protein [Glycomyces buryatensis]|uniref:Uncharacterized protein n=1 Tax=Glycomyces buryatensis TaxID=2570927 RepID=A0A4S8QIG5_9ACTN|nr:hypothetical protein [Glycomyces buryatensis]THV42785.1 hypothetical protein FAB82_04505 [Glycomyces buryatensis]
MDHQTPPADTGTGRIWVEPAEYEVSQKPVPPRRQSIRRAPAPAPCWHRVRLHQLQPSWQALFALVVTLVFASLVSAAGLFFAGAVSLLWGMVSYDVLLTAIGTAMLICMAFAIGAFVSCIRTWRRLHRPGTGALATSTAGALVTLALAILVASAMTIPWVLAFTVSPLAMASVLWYLWLVLYDRSTCVEYPVLPPRVQAMLKRP